MTRTRARWTMAVVAALLAGPAPVLGRLVRNTIDATARLHAGGRVAEGVVLVGCTPGERVALRLTITH